MGADVKDTHQVDIEYKQCYEQVREMPQLLTQLAREVFPERPHGTTVRYENLTKSDKERFIAAYEAYKSKPQEQAGHTDGVDAGRAKSRGIER